MHISPSAGDILRDGGVHLSQNAGSVGYPTRQELGESVPSTRKKSKDIDLGDSARK